MPEFITASLAKMQASKGNLMNCHFERNAKCCVLNYPDYSITSTFDPAFLPAELGVGRLVFEVDVSGMMFRLYAADGVLLSNGAKNVMVFDGRAYNAEMGVIGDMNEIIFDKP